MIVNLESPRSEGVGEWLRAMLNEMGEDMVFDRWWSMFRPPLTPEEERMGMFNEEGISRFAWSEMKS